LAEQGIAVLFSPVSEVYYEVLDLLASGIAQSLYATELSRVALDQVRIELMLADGWQRRSRTVRPPKFPLPLAGCGAFLLTEPISSTEQMPIPYAFRNARFTARVSATRISAP